MLSTYYDILDHYALRPSGKQNSSGAVAVFLCPQASLRRKLQRMPRVIGSSDRQDSCTSMGRYTRSMHRNNFDWQGVLTECAASKKRIFWGSDSWSDSGSTRGPTRGPSKALSSCCALGLQQRCLRSCTHADLHGTQCMNCACMQQRNGCGWCTSGSAGVRRAARSWAAAADAYTPGVVCTTATPTTPLPRLYGTLRRCFPWPDRKCTSPCER
jgi:hypothetical protein